MKWKIFSSSNISILFFTVVIPRGLSCRALPPGWCRPGWRGCTGCRTPQTSPGLCPHNTSILVKSQPPTLTKATVECLGSTQERGISTNRKLHTDKKEKIIFLIHKEILNGAVAKSFMRKGFLIYEEMRKYLLIYEEFVSHIWLCNCSLMNFLLYKENLIFLLISALYLQYSFTGPIGGRIGNITVEPWQK